MSLKSTISRRSFLEVEDLLDIGDVDITDGILARTDRLAQDAPERGKALHLADQVSARKVRRGLRRARP